MARPARQATCHPDKKHRALGLCNNCYINSRHRTPEGRAARHDYYVRNKAMIQQRAARYYRDHKERQVKLAVVRTRKRRMRVGYQRPVPKLSELPRETPVGSCDKDWWKPKDIPKRWKLGT